MPRGQRRKSSTGVYHVIYRGINKERIFKDHEDYRQFLSVLKKYTDDSQCEIYAYCLMSNHVHLLIKEGNEDLGQTFRRIGPAFVYWYNVKYGRVGHLFQDRYKSEPVEDEGYFLNVIRYIHLNPVKAGLCIYPENYRYSSFAKYESNPLIKSGLVFSIIGRDRFYSHHLIPNNDKCLDIPDQDTKRLTDENIRQILIKTYLCNSPSDFGKLTRERQEDVLCSLINAGGSLRQVSRLTGATVNLIRYVLSKKKT